MNSSAFRAEELLERATALAKSNRNLELMDRATVLHGYLQLTRLDPNNKTYQETLEYAVAILLGVRGIQAWQRRI